MKSGGAIAPLAPPVPPPLIEDDNKVVYYDIQQCITEGLKEVSSCMSNDLKYGFYCIKQGCLKTIFTLSSKH